MGTNKKDPAHIHMPGHPNNNFTVFSSVFSYLKQKAETQIL